MPSLRQLEYLIALSDTRHFRKAAEQMGVSQPTLSAQLAELERRLGVQLVERNTSGVLMTPVGERVLAHARQVASSVQAIRELAQSHRGGLSGVLRMGLPHTIGPYLLPYLIGPLHRAHKDLRLYVREDLPLALPDALERGVHDVLIVPIPIRSGEFVIEPLYRERLHLVAPIDHALAIAGSARRSDLKDEPVLALGPGHQLRTQVEELCGEFGAQLLTSFEGTSLDTLRQMVGMGLGLTFLPDLYVRRELPGDTAVKSVELKGRALFRTIGLVWRRSSALGDSIGELASEIKAALKISFPDIAIL